MMKLRHFTPEDIPYEKLEKFGLTREMVEDLPQVITQRLMAARATPPLPVITDGQNGEKVMSLARISLIRLQDGTVDVMLAPRWKAYDLDIYSNAQQQKLLDGKVIMTNVEGKGLCYGQYDDSIQQVMTVPVGVIKQNIEIIHHNSPHMTDNQTESVAMGKIVELQEPEGSMTSIGIDLEEICGIRFAEGDAVAWEQEKKASQLPQYSFGLFGCWKEDENGCLSYIPENEFTPEMWNEQRRAGQQNAARESMTHLHI